jgi:hypothetical protein
MNSAYLAPSGPVFSVGVTQAIVRAGLTTFTLAFASASTPWVLVALAGFSKLPVRAAFALNANSLLWPGVSVPASNETEDWPASVVRPDGRVSVTFTPVSVLLPLLRTTSFTGIGSHWTTCAGMVFANSMAGFTTLIGSQRIGL